MQWVHPKDAAQAQSALQAHLKGQSDAADLRFRLQHRDGRWIWLQAWGRVVARDPATGRATVMAGILRDVSDEVALEQSRAIAASVFNDAGEAIVVTDERGAVLDANAAMLQMSGYTRDELIGRANLPWRPADRHGTPDWHRLRRVLRREGRWRGEAWWRRRDGTEFPVVEAISAVRDDRGQIIRYVAVAQDITELKAQQNALERQAYYDLLTGLPNRVLLADRLDLAIASARRHQRRVAVAYLDLDGFKYVNDSHGHRQGDWILRLVAQRLQGALREGDTLARVGGDEFVAVLCDLDDSERWTAVIDRLLAASAEPIEYGGTLVQLSTSIGVTLYPDDGADARCCCAMPIRPCTAPSATAKTAGICSTRKKTGPRRPTPSAWRMCGARWPARASSACTCNRKSASSMAPSRGPRPCCAGSIRSGDCWRRPPFCPRSSTTTP